MAYYPSGSPHAQDQQPARPRRSDRYDNTPKQPRQSKAPRAKRPHGKRRTWIFVLIVILALSLIGSMIPKTPVPPFRQGETSNWVRNGVQGIVYRVGLEKQCTDAELHAVYDQLTKNDGYKLHMVAFWSSPDLMLDGWGSDVGSISDENGRKVLERK